MGRSEAGRNLRSRFTFVYQRGTPQMSGKNKLPFKSALAILLMTTLIPLTIVEAQEVTIGNQMEGNVRQNSNCSQASEVEQYWTPERMQNAQPLPLTRPGYPQPVSPQPAPPSDPEVSAPSSSSGEASQPPTEKR